MFQLINLLKNPAGWLTTQGEFSDYALSSRVRLARNLTGHRYPHAAGGKELSLVLGQTFEALRKTREMGRAAYLKLSDLDDVDLAFLVERHLISADLTQKTQNRAVVVGDKELASLMVNEEDHVRLQAIYPGLELFRALDAALVLDQNLSRLLPYAYHEEFGFLTSCPTNIGTGLRASCLVHLPALAQTQAIGPVFQELSRAGLAVRGFYGEGSNVYGDLFQISNATTIGKSEAEFVATISNILKSLFKHESEVRSKMFKGSEGAKIVDKIWRTYGALGQCRFISYAETMRYLSLLRLGLTAKILTGRVSLEDVNRLIIMTQPAHIQMQAGRTLNPAERDEFRATLVRQALKN
ncbi:MAG: ATP--guanido phosphotransferase [Elusimicrobia bacterium]|nr:ATP--guanido phosphotransferase [Elusimicrobiota bacterium]